MSKTVEDFRKWLRDNKALGKQIAKELEKDND